jgi:hypothetical protein
MGDLAPILHSPNSLPGQDERAFISLVDERTYHLLDTGEPLEREKV